MLKMVGIEVDGLAVYVNPTTGKAKIGSKGKALPLPEALGVMPKGARRALRKTLRREGFSHLAGVPTVPCI